jgi:hypothetical protein
MSQSVRDFERTFTAGEDMDTKQYFIVQLDASGNAELGESATDLLIGVLQNKPKSGEAALVRFGGTSKVIAGGAVAIGDWVTTDSAGETVATTTDGNITIGRALEAADDGDIFEVLLSIQHLYIA